MSENVTVSSRSLFATAFLAFFTALLIWTEIWVGLVATAWSVADMLHLGMTGYVLVGIVGIPAALWASWKSLMLAWQSERTLDEGY